MRLPRFAARCGHFRLWRSAGSTARTRYHVAKPAPPVSRRSARCMIRNNAAASSHRLRVRISCMGKPPVCLTIAGLDPSGGAGIIADIKTFSAFGCFAAAAVASITFQNTIGVFGSEHQSAEGLRRQIAPVVEDYNVAAVKTGMLPTREVIDEVAKIVRELPGVKLVVDPVVRSTSGFDLIDDAALRSLIEFLFPLADLVTPNLPEAERITGLTIRSEDDVRAAAKRMQTMGARAVLI